MSSAKRPNNGCWTCRLRHKKCDEGFPLCATCERLEVVCYRSDEKPEFMDGGEREKMVSSEISSHIKARNATLRRSRALEAKRRQQGQLQNIAASSQNNGPINETAKSKTPSLPESLVPNSNSLSTSSVQFTPSSWKNLNSPGPALDLISCEAWVKDLIGEIGALDEQKYQLGLHPDEIDGFSSKAERLKDLLEEATPYFIQRYGEIEESASHYTIEVAKAKAHLQLMKVWVTGIFVRAAFIYLHIALHGMDLQALPAANKLTFEWIFNFRFIPDRNVLPSLVWPLCMAGCMASTTQQKQFFRDTITFSGVDPQSPCLIWRALEIMEECWKVNSSGSMQPGDPIWRRELGLLLRDPDVL